MIDAAQPQDGGFPPPADRFVPWDALRTLVDLLPPPAAPSRPPAAPRANVPASPPTGGYTSPADADRDHPRGGRLRRAEAWLANRDPAVSGRGGHTHTLETAGAVRIGFALDESESLSLLAAWNARCVPPWDDHELARKVSEAAKNPRGYPWGYKLNDRPPRHAGGPTAANATGPPARPAPADDLKPAGGETEIANGRRFVADHGDRIRYVSDWGCWVVYDGRRWGKDADGRRVQELAKATAVRMGRQAVEDIAIASGELVGAMADAGKQAAAKEAMEKGQQRLKWAVFTQSARGVANMARLASSDPSVLVPVGEEVFDRRPDRLNAANGTICLRTGESRPHHPADFVTKRCPTRYAPDAECPRFTRFIAELFPGRPAVAEYVLDVLGYAVTGEVTDQAYYLLDGAGSNGKTLLLETVQDVIGPDYCYSVPPEVLSDIKGTRHPTERVGFRGARIAVAEETEEGGGINEARIKQLSGGGRMQAREIGGNFFEFAPTHKLFLATNHKPTIKGTDHGTWRRPRVVPFDARFYLPHELAKEPGLAADPNARPVDATLKSALAAEAEGVLALLVRRAVKFHAGDRTLPPPGEVVEAAEEYRREMDTVGEFFDRRTRPSDYPIKANELYKAYKQFIEDEGGRHPVGPRKFGERAKKRFKSVRQKLGLCYYLDLVSEADADARHLEL